MASISLYLVTFAILLKITFSAHLVINRGDNVNGDNDETPTTTSHPDPPIQEQFAVVGSRLTAKQPPAPVFQEPIKEEVKEYVNKDTDDTENLEEEFETENQSEARKLWVEGKKRLKQAPMSFQKGVSCGYYRMKNGNAISIQSTNFNSGATYRNNEICTWKFFGQQCRLKTTCPCADLATTPDCTGDHLKISDMFSFAHKFCGDLKPQGTYNSTTNNLKIHFRSDSRSTDSGTGFICYVTCTGPGKMDPVQLTQKLTCPTST